MKGLITQLLASQMVQMSNREEKRKNGFAVFFAITSGFAYITGLVFLVMLAFQALQNSSGSDVIALSFMGIGLLCFATLLALTVSIIIRSKKPKTPLLFDITESLVSGFVEGLHKGKAASHHDVIITDNVTQHPSTYYKSGTNL